MPSALVAHGPRAAAAALDRLIGAAGADNVFVELWDHGDPLDCHRNDALAELAVRRGVQPVCANAVRYAAPRDRALADALAAVGARRSLDDHNGWLPAWGGAHLRVGAEQARRFARYPAQWRPRPAWVWSAPFSLSLVAPDLAGPIRAPTASTRPPSCAAGHRGRPCSATGRRKPSGCREPGARSATSWT